MTTLRPYQEQAVAKALQARHCTIKAATGTGKTIIAIEWIKSIDLRTLIIVPTQALIFQSWAPKLQEAHLLDVGQYYAYAKQEGKIMVTTYSSAISHQELLERAQAVVLDEIHHLGAKTALSRLLTHLKQKQYVLGLSSVPERTDDTHELFLNEFPICFDLSIGEAMHSGIVAPLEVVEIQSEMREKEKESYEKYTKKIRRAFKICGNNIANWNKCFDPLTKQYVGRQGMVALMKRKKLLSRVESKKEKILDIALRHPHERIIVFAESVQAIEEIKYYLISNEILCETYHSHTETWRRMEILEDWGRNFDILLSCRALEEGLDVKEVAIGILVASGTSKRQYIQRIGRIIRPIEGKKAMFYVLYCPLTVEESYAKKIEKILHSE